MYGFGRVVPIDVLVDQFGCTSDVAAFLVFLFRQRRIGPDIALSWGWLSGDNPGRCESHRLHIWLVSSRYILVYTPDFCGRAMLAPLTEPDLEQKIVDWLGFLPRPDRAARLGVCI